MIREKIYKDIANTIDKHPRFESSDFKVEANKDQRSSYTVLNIKYNIESKYKITFKIPTSTTSDKESYGEYYAFSGSVCPGPLAYDENFSFKGEAGIFEKITIWLNCIWEELSSNPIVKKVEFQQQQIEEIFEKFESIKDEYFSEDEAKELRKKLDGLEETLKEQIKQNQDDKKIFDKEIENLHNDIDTLKQTIHSFKKKGWLKSFTTKVFKWTKDSENRTLLKDGYKVIREFLPEDIKGNLPDLE
jgi:gas vesicle protein